MDILTLGLESLDTGALSGPTSQKPLGPNISFLHFRIYCSLIIHSMASSQNKLELNVARLPELAKGLQRSNPLPTVLERLGFSKTPLSGYETIRNFAILSSNAVASNLQSIESCYARDQSTLRGCVVGSSRYLCLYLTSAVGVAIEIFS
jgi:hypothetical protein